MSVSRVSALCAATMCLAGAAAPAAAASVASVAAPGSTVAVPAGDAAFLTAAHQGNLFEIDAGQQAQSDAVSPCVRSVGARFVRDHRVLDAAVVATAARFGVRLPADTSGALRQQLTLVRSRARTAAYDATWLRQQYTAHVQTLALIDKELTSGSNPTVKAAARAARPVVAEHTQMVSGGVCHGTRPSGPVSAGEGGRLAAAAYGPQGTTTALVFGGVLVTGSGVAFVKRRRRSVTPGARG